MDLIIYHVNSVDTQCTDGFCAAWIAKGRYPQAELMPAMYNETPAPIERIIGKDVLIVDFSFPRADMISMKEVARSLVVLDHHKSAKEDCEGLPFGLFDMERSGAGMTWDFLFPNKERPEFVNYVEDWDLYRFALPDSKILSAAVKSYDDHTLYSMARLADEFESAKGLMKLREIGIAIERHETKMVRGLVRQAREFLIDGHEVLGVEAPHMLRNRVGHELAIGRPFGVVFQTMSDGRVAYSLRSDPDQARTPNSVDVSAVCKKFGGGGHASASGFVVKPAFDRIEEEWLEPNSSGFPWKPGDMTRKSQ